MAACLVPQTLRIQSRIPVCLCSLLFQHLPFLSFERQYLVVMLFSLMTNRTFPVVFFHVSTPMFIPCFHINVHVQYPCACPVSIAVSTSISMYINVHVRVNVHVHVHIHHHVHVACVRVCVHVQHKYRDTPYPAPPPQFTWKILQRTALCNESDIQ